MKQFRQPKTTSYTRMSTTGQNLARQLVALHEAGISNDPLMVTSLDRFGQKYAEKLATCAALEDSHALSLRAAARQCTSPKAHSANTASC